MDPLIAEMQVEREERNKWLQSYLYREKDIAARKCPKCANTSYAFVSIDNCNGIFTEGSPHAYCPACKAILKSEEMPIE